MDRSRLTLSSLDELRQIRADIRGCESLDMVRRSFERVQEIRRQHLDDFDLQIVIADAQQEIIERARFLRRQAEAETVTAETVAAAVPGFSSKAIKVAAKFNAETAAKSAEPVKPTPTDEKEFESAEIPDSIPKLDRKAWQLAVGLALLFTVGIFASFFYLIQAARRLNFGDEQAPVASVKTPPAAAATRSTAPDPTIVKDGLAATVAPVNVVKPTLRLYTDLTGGAVSIDGQPPKDLGDGELDLDSLTPGEHNVRVDSRGGGAAFSFSLDGQKDVPRVTQISKSSNAMVVLVSVKDGTGRLHTDAAGALVSLDGKPAGAVTGDGLLLLDLGSRDHGLEVTQGLDKQKFVLTYTPAPTLTVFVKSDPSIGILTVSAAQDGVSVFINGLPYKRVTDHGSVRIPLKVGGYRIRVHQSGFQDPPEQMVEIKKSAEASLQFHLLPVVDFGMLQIKGAVPGTVALIDHQLAAMAGADGTAKVPNIKPGDHVIELHHEAAVPKQLTRTFTAGQSVTLSGPDVLLDRLAADNKTVIPAAPGPPVIAPPPVPPLLPAAVPSATGEQVHKGGGFIPYHTPKLPGRYYFQAHTKLGGVLKHGRLEWYAGYQDEKNYVLFSLDGKHAEVKEVRDGKPVDIGRIPFNLASDQWVQIEMTVKPDGVQARAKAGLDDWTELTPVSAAGHDLTKSNVGLFVAPNEEVAVANFRFSTK